MKAELITIGDELLIGQIVDTNSAWMAAELNNIGIEVVQITSISDNNKAITETLDATLLRADVILITGGLGPTNDDLTKKVLTAYFDSELINHQPTLNHITQLFQKRGLPLTRLNEEQALVPACCDVLFNENGTAPGMWFRARNRIVVSMPGVPFEMKGIMQDHVLPRLSEMNRGQAIAHRTLLTIGLPESILAETIESWENALPRHIKLAYLPSPEHVKLRLTARGERQEELNKQIEDQIEKLKILIPDVLFGFNDDTLASVTGRLLSGQGKTLSTAESCTGGNIAHQITLVVGSSDWYRGSVVAYSNEIKSKLLGVSEQDLEQYGAVSEPVVRQMAEGVRRLMGTDYSVATSGIAGPGGGSEEKPVGLVWMAVSGPNGTIAQQMKFSNNRERNITRSTQAALNQLRLTLLNDFR